MKSEHQSALSPKTAPDFVTGCPFCTIDPQRTTVVEQTHYTRVVLSNPRLVPGHLLLIPIRHVELLSQLTAQELQELVSLTIQYQEKIVCRLSPGCDLRQNYHPFEPQGEVKVDHLHLHLIPRALNDDLYEKVQQSEEQLFQMVSEQEKKKFTDFYRRTGTKCY